MPSVIVNHKRPVPVHGMSREFSSDVHGESYKEKAKLYAETSAKDNVASIEGLDEELETEEQKSEESESQESEEQNEPESQEPKKGKKLKK